MVMTMSRTKEFNEDKALEAAMFLFWEKGYEATSMQALEESMGLKRTSIYNAFGNKRALYQQALNKYLSTVLRRFLFVLNESATTREGIQQVLNEVLNLHFNKKHPGGCMIVLSLLESNQHDKDTNAQLDSALKQLCKAIVKRLQQGVEDGDIKNNLKCNTVGTQVTALITGMIVMAKANFPKKDLEKLIENSLLTLMD